MRKIDFKLSDGTVVPVGITELPGGGGRFRWGAEDGYLQGIADALNSMGLYALVDKDAGGKYVKVTY